jgi:hypothetical protein
MSHCKNRKDGKTCPNQSVSPMAKQPTFGLLCGDQGLEAEPKPPPTCSKHEGCAKRDRNHQTPTAARLHPNLVNHKDNY